MSETNSYSSKIYEDITSNIASVSDMSQMCSN